MHCDGKCSCEKYQGGNIFFVRYYICPFHDRFFIEFRNVGRRRFGTLAEMK